MSRRSQSVGALAARAELDYDETLVLLWESGLEYPDAPDSLILLRDLPVAERALGLSTVRERTLVNYWLAALGVDRAALAALLMGHGIRLAPESRRLPKGALAKLSRHAPFAPATSSPSTTRAAPAVTESFAPSMDWVPIGREVRDVQLPTYEQILGVHEALVLDFCESGDPIEPSGVRSEPLLRSALDRPQTSLGPTRKYATVEMAGAALFHSLVHNHPFFNGNKRTAIVSLLAMLDLNNLVLTATQDELFKFALRVASHGLIPKSWDQRPDREVLEISAWIRKHSRLVDKAERQIKWVQLRRILVGYGCSVEHARGSGARMNVLREVETGTTWLGRKKTTALTCQVGYADEGRDVARGDLNHLRRTLWLDDEHGIDSELFYGTDRRRVDEFITMYRKTLNRLARL